MLVVKKDQMVAQIVFQKREDVIFVKTDPENFTKTERGLGGFGSTGVF